MIPEICANCGKGVNVPCNEEIIGTVCHALPVKVWKELTDVCGAFEMSRTPTVALPDDDQGFDREDGNGPSDGTGEADGDE